MNDLKQNLKTKMNMKRMMLAMLPMACMVGSTWAETCPVLQPCEFTWDLAFYQPDGWPAPFFLSSSSNSFVACTRFLEGDTIYSSFAYTDLVGDADIPQEFACTLYLMDSIYGGFHWADALKVNTYGISAFTTWTCLDNLPPGEYTATWELNAPIDWLPDKPRVLHETNYANNSNSVSFVVVPATKVTFMSLGSKVDSIRYEKNGRFWKLPDAPIRFNYRFKGWYSAEEDGVRITESSEVPDSDTTLYARWEPEQKDPVEVVSLENQTTWQSGNLYVIEEDITVPSGGSLTIQPGTIVKFKAGKSLTVAYGATLLAHGTNVMPIEFTSINDDTVGGKTEGSNSSPAGGDWNCINILSGNFIHGNGVAEFDFCKIRYNSPMPDRAGLQCGGTVMFDNSEIAETMYDSIGGRGSFTARNSVFRDTSLAFGYNGYGCKMYNCVVANCTTAVRNIGKTFYNTIFYNCINFTDQGGERNTFNNCCFFNPSGRGNLFDATIYNKDTNIWGDPLFVDPEKGNFRIAANSPCVDAADGSVAPERDRYGAPRMNVESVRPKGIASVNGAVPDIGIYEVPSDGDIPSADLEVASVDIPAMLTVGEPVEISWTVRNVGTEPAYGSWRDEIELVAVNGQVFSVGTVTTHAQIKPGDSTNFTASLSVPAAPEGAVHVCVTANKHLDVFEAKKIGNNANVASATLTVPTIAVPTDGTAAMITLGGGLDTGFALDGGGATTQGGVLVIRGAGDLDAWLGNGSIAVKDNAIRSAVQIADGTWLLQIPAGSKPRVTVRNSGEETVAVSLSLETGDFFLLDTGVMHAANSGLVTVPLAGNGFDETVECWLLRGGTRIDANDFTVGNGISATVTFDVTGCDAGDWELHARKEGREVSATFLVLTKDRNGPDWYGNVVVPDVIRQGRSYVGTFQYGNNGDTAMNAPYVRLEAKRDTLIRLSDVDAWSKSIELMAASDTYPASVLKAGDSSKVTFFYKTTGTQAEIDYACTFSSTNDIPWMEMQGKMRPAWATDELWGFAFGTLRANLGETWNDYLARMRSDCDHFLRIGSPVKRMDRMMQLEVNEAFGGDTALSRLASATDLSRSVRGLSLSFSRTYSASLRSRFANGTLGYNGALGYGWTDNFSTYAELQDAGMLVFHLPSGGSYSFTKASGTWQPSDARDKTVLKETDTAYTLTYASGTVQVFAKNSLWPRTTSIRDNQGNELSFLYNGQQLVKVEHSDGQFLAFTYSGDRLVKAVDDQGRETSYGYTDDLLTSVTAFNGLVTRYEYISAAGEPVNRALSKIVYPDGSSKEFAYDEKGLVASSSVNGGQFKTEITRGDFGCYSITAPNGGVTEVTVGANGETLKTVNALGEVVRQTYTADSLLEATIAPSGKRSKITYDKSGSPIASMSASGATTAFSYMSEFDNLASVTDAKGHSFNYGYDELGRNTSVTYADGTASMVEYNERGDVVKSANRRGETIEYEYDGEGNLTKKTWPNGRTFTMAYDAKGNVTNAADSVTGEVTMEYDANERLTRIVYPKGRGFTYTYDAVGRMVERSSLGGTGFVPSAADTQRFTYDSLGRLSTVTDGDGNLYLTNSYDPTTGWLVTQAYGNGTIVSNAYDILGRTVGIYHGRAVSMKPPYMAFFEYAYDADGKCVSQTTAEGIESYTYDADGQLAGVTYPDDTSESFTYDAVGNRISSGRAASPLAAATTTAYTVNNLNQYTQIDDTTLEYDLDGNMTRNGNTLYYYDTLNRLVAVTNETKNIRWSCEYDVFGNRVSVTDNGTTTEKVFVQGSLPSVSAEYVDGSLTKRHILVGAVRLMDITTHNSQLTTTYYHADLLGSARLLTDGTGATKGTRSFKAFGETRTSSGETTDAGYVGTLGIETDSHGLLFMRNRYYSAGMGRFVQMDPAGFRSKEINFYRYGVNSPSLYIDVSGYEPITLCGVSIDRYVRRTGYNPFAGKSSVFDGFSVTEYDYSTQDQKLAGFEGFFCAERPNDIYMSSNPNNAALNQELSEVHEFIHAWLTHQYPTIKNTRETEYLAYYLSEYYLYKQGNIGMPSWQDIVDYVDREYAENLHWDMPMAAEKVEEIKNKVMQSLDPNEISGSLGMGKKRYKLQGDWMDYAIYFENKTNATAAAQEVFVDLPMDDNLDWSTLELGELVFGEHIDTTLVEKKLAGKSKLTASYAMPGTNTFVKTTVTMKDGVLSWYIRDWDPTTTDNFPASATGGFLPPNNPETHCGEGRISFRVRVKSEAPDGAIVRAFAQIVFDNNPMIETDPSWWNTVGLGGAQFIVSEVEADEGSNVIVRVKGGNMYTNSSVKVYATWNTAGTLDVDLKTGTVADGGGRGATALPGDEADARDARPYQTGLKFPLTLKWAAGEIGEKVISIPIKADVLVEGEEFFTLQLAAASGMELGEERVCTVRIKDAQWPDVADDEEAAARGLAALPAGATAVYAARPASGTYQEGDVLVGYFTKKDKKGNVTAKAMPGYVFVGWVYTKNGKTYSTKATIADKLRKSKKVTPKFAEARYLRALADPANGGKVTGGGKYAEGKKATLKATPAKYWSFAGWYAARSASGPYQGDEATANDSYRLLTTAAKTTVTVTNDATYFAAFKPYPKVSVAVNNKSGGTVKGAGSYLAGKTATLKATPKKGYAFCGWVTGSGEEGTVLSLAATYKYKVPADGATLTAMFKKESALARPVLTWGDYVVGDAARSASGPYQEEDAQAARSTNLTVGVSYSAKLSVKGESAVSITKVTGLPKGLKYKGGKVTGVPTVKKVYTATVTVALASNKKKTWTYKVKLDVAALPAWAVGTFKGTLYAAVAGETPPAAKGAVTLTVGKTGKVSGKFVDAKKKSYSFSTGSFKSFADGVLRAKANMKYGKKTVAVDIAVGLDGETSVGFAEVGAAAAPFSGGTAVLGR